MHIILYYCPIHCTVSFANFLPIFILIRPQPVIFLEKDSQSLASMHAPYYADRQFFKILIDTIHLIGLIINNWLFRFQMSSRYKEFKHGLIFHSKFLCKERIFVNSPHKERHILCDLSWARNE